MNANEARKLADGRPSKYDMMCTQWMVAIDATIRAEARNGGHSIMVPVHPVEQVMKLAMKKLQEQGFRIDMKKPHVQISWSK